MVSRKSGGEEDFARLGRDQLAGRLHLRLSTELWLRFHTGLIVAGTIFVAFFTSLGLQHAGPLRHWLGVRYGIACLAGYAAFLLFVRWWVRYVAGIREAVGQPDSDRGRFESARLFEGSAPQKAHKDGSKDDDGRGCTAGDGCDAGCLDLEGLGILVAIVVIAWIFSAGPLILSEIAADTLLAGGLLRWARRTEVSWMVSAWRATRLPFAVTTLVTVVFGLIAQSLCAGAVRFGEVWGCLVSR